MKSHASKIIVLGGLALFIGVLTFVGETISPQQAFSSTTTSGKPTIAEEPKHTDMTLYRQINQIGMRGDDIKAIKEILNEYDDTRIADTGIDSPGNESDVFTEATSAAIKKFQLKYKSSLMDPWKIKEPSGLVTHPALVAKFNLLIQARTAWFYRRDVTINAIVKNNYAEKDVLSKITTLFNDTSYKKRLYSIKVFPATANPGQKVTIYGSGFSYIKSPMIDLGGVTVPLTVETNYKATATISDQAIPGMYIIQATSTTPLPPQQVGSAYAKLIIQKTLAQIGQSATAPNIESITPARAYHGSMVTIKGNNFTPTGNRVWTAYGFIDDIPSPDGKTLTFKMYLKPINDLYLLKQKLHDNHRRNPIPGQFTYKVGVLNSNGSSKQTLLFTAVIW